MDLQTKKIKCPNCGQEIDVDESEAINKNGLLIIRMPKIDKHRQAKLKIKSV